MKKNIILVNGVKTTINEEDFKNTVKKYKSGDDLVSYNTKQAKIGEAVLLKEGEQLGATVGTVFGAKTLGEVLNGVSHIPYGVGREIYKMASERDVRVSRSFKTFYADIKECEPEDELECVRLLVNSCRAEGWDIRNDDSKLCNMRGYMNSRKIRRIQEGRNFYITPIMDDLYSLFKHIKEINK